MTDPITRLNAALEGRYHVEREIGEGGMATVYLAEDLRHERKVALKVLKPELAAVVGADRFLAEIKTTANLKHPHILPLFDSGEADSFLYYVMPYVEGDSLRARIDRDKQLPVDEAVGIARKVAGALAHAHEHGVVHRDIKPGNILFQDDEPVVTDFGIALAVGSAGGARLTETGLSVGTPFYMSPEQATGDQGVGPASDTYSLACVLYEMLVGDPPYPGSTAQAVLGKIIQGIPVSATASRASVPTNVDSAIRKALEKLPADRFTGAQEFARALTDPGFRHGEVAGVAAAGVGRPAWQTAALVGGALLAGAFGGTLVFGGGDAPATSGLVRFVIDPPESAPFDATGGGLPDLAISRDGRQVAYKGPNAAGDGPQLNLRPIEQLGAAPLRGAEGGLGPFFSPDGEWVGFVAFQTQTLLRVSVLGGTPVTLAESPGAVLGASWGEDDEIVFGTAAGGLYRVPAGGGEPEALTSLDQEQGEAHHLWPFIIEGRNAVLFAILDASTVSAAQLAVLDRGSEEVRRLGVAGTSPRYVRTGHLVYAADDGSVRAVPFDVGSLEVTGSPVPLVEGVVLRGNGASDFSISDDGRLVYVSGSAFVGAAEYQLVWVDRDGNEELLPLPPRGYRELRVSPDGRRFTTSVEDEEGMDLWVYDVASGAGLQLTENDEIDWVPMWSPDGTRIYFSSLMDAPQPPSFTGTVWYGNVWSVPADGSAPAERMMETEENQAIQGITPDGQTLIYTDVIDNNTQWEIMGVPTDGSGDPVSIVSGPSRRGTGSVSSNGRWLTYRSDESGVFEVYVQPYPGPGARVPVSIQGGVSPMWAHEGNELYYRRGDGTMMVAEIAGDEVPEVVSRTELFSANPYRWEPNGNRTYHVAPDGRFLMQRPPGTGAEDDAGPPQITVVLNWFEELRERVPVP